MDVLFFLRSKRTPNIIKRLRIKIISKNGILEAVSFTKTCMEEKAKTDKRIYKMALLCLYMFTALG